MALPRTLRVAILLADVPMPEIVAKHGDYLAMFTHSLRTGAQQLSPSVTVETTGFDVVNDPPQYPVNPSDYDAILITGSKADCYRDLPWIERLVHYVHDTATEHPTLKWLGVCFGHQVIARAFGQATGVSSEGWEIGNVDLKLTDVARQLFNTSRDTMKIYQIHRDIVKGCPKGFQVLASSPRCANHGMVKGEQILTIQGHPEYPRDAVELVARSRGKQGIIPSDRVAECLATIQDPNDSLWMCALMIRFVLGAL